MGTDKECTGIIETILILADKLGKQAIAEGVETPDQLSQLVAAGCDYGQGFLFSRPLASEAAQSLLANREIQKGAANSVTEPGKDVEVVTDIYAM